jgi:benzoyl-CoA reductase/2-hydroxyglutaryl-CoA dehydratase subunit BcrC/BadD/HgdB
MEFFDAVPSQAQLWAKEAKEQGRKIVGTYCVFSPIELIEAAGAIPVGLCSTKLEPIAEAEKVLPRNLCPLIKSSFGFAVSGKCPYFVLSDAVLAETTCDGKKKMYEIMQTYKPMLVLDIPNTTTGEDYLDKWVRAIYQAKEYFEALFNTEITAENLSRVIKEHNEERRLMMELAALNQNDPAPLAGTDLLKVLWGRNFRFRSAEYLDKTRELITEIKEMMKKGEISAAPGRPRILVTGCPTGSGQEKVLNIIEESGGSVLIQESCSGIKPCVHLVDEQKDPFVALAEKYAQTPCSVLSPNTGRMDLLSRLVEDYKVDGVVDITLQFCHTYNIESVLVKEHLQKKHNVPLLQIETDYSSSDTQQIKLRVEAFLEMLK